jgi:sugar phosphate isomerase/epimerase
MQEIGINHLCTLFGDPDSLPLAFRTDEKEIENHKKVAADYGLSFAEIAITDDFEKQIPLAAALDVEYVRVCDEWEDDEETFQRIVGTLKQISGLSQQHDLEVIVENHGGLMRTGQNCRKLLETVGADNMSLNYDPANFLYFGEDPLKALDETLDLVGFTHFKGLKYNENQEPEYCRLNEGVIEYGPIFDKLMRSYDGYIGLEYEDPEDPEKGTIDDFEFLKEMLGE